MIRALFACMLMVAAPVQAQIKIEEVTSPGGVKAWLVNEPSIPFLALSISFRGGTSLDPVEKLGVTSLMAGLLEEGTGDLDARGFREAAESLAARLTFDAGRDSVSVNAQVLTANRDASMDLLRRALVEPSFDTEALERVRGQVLAGIEADTQNPRAIASRRLSEIAYGTHPYGRPTDGTIETVTALTRNDLFAAHRRVIAREHVVVSAVGDITGDELGALIDKLLDGLPEDGAELPETVAFGASGGIEVIDLPTPQSVAVWGQPGMALDDPDFIPAFVMNQILGGSGFGSRLTFEVREKRGLTYGIYSYLAFRSHSSFLGGAVASANGTIAEAIDLVKSEWQRMADEGVTEEELERIQKNLTGAYALRFDGNGQIARVLQGMQMDGFPITYVNTRNDRVNAVTVDD
ncbi:MAG: pitrilysin family protein, partial [Pseudomonadota bacterium]